MNGRRRHTKKNYESSAGGGFSLTLNLQMITQVGTEGPGLAAAPNAAI